MSKRITVKLKYVELNLIGCIFHEETKNVFCLMPQITTKAKVVAVVAPVGQSKRQVFGLLN